MSWLQKHKGTIEAAFVTALFLAFLVSYIYTDLLGHRIDDDRGYMPVRSGPTR